MESITSENISQVINQDEYLLFDMQQNGVDTCQRIKPMNLKDKEGLQTDGRLYD